MTGHLDEDQIAELLALSPHPDAHIVGTAEAHMEACRECASRVAEMRESLTLFREATTAYAEAQLRTMPPVSVPACSGRSLRPVYFAVAATVLLGALAPVQMAYRHRIQNTPPAVAVMPTRPAAESDEALLEDVNREISESVPTPMQALQDPTGSAAISHPDSMQRTD